ncbi:MAG: hypothetical protein R3B93_14905 [Bacteroidia bacterium]
MEKDKKQLRGYRRRLLWLILISSGIDAAMFTAEPALLIPSFGSSLVVDEIIEYIISNLLAKNKLDLKKRYKIVGILPIPGVTSLSTQALIELIRSYRKPEKILARLNAGEKSDLLEG